MQSLNADTDLGGAADDRLAAPWDYVLVGAGAAGCVLAHRLSEDAGVRVLLIEAGGEARDAAVDAPGAWPTLQGGAFDWRYVSTPQTGLFGRVLEQPRGKGLGGSTLINALGFQRGPRGAYDRWAEQTGDAGWGYASLLPYFKRLETTTAGSDEYRGRSGPLQVLPVGDASDANAYARAVGEAAVQVGLASNPDGNGYDVEGLSWAQLCIRDGRRDSAATAYLDPIRSRPNLAILTNAVVTRLDVEQGRCIGVQVQADGRSASVAARRETILCAGAVDSPRLLMLSGIGPAANLARLGVTPLVDLPAVGQHLQDHPLGPGLLFQATGPLPRSNYNHCENVVFARSRHAHGWADIEVMALCVPFLSPSLGEAPANSMSFVPCVLEPRSRGSVTLSSRDPFDPARIDPAYLQDPRDVEAMVDGISLGRKIASAEALRPWISQELFPGAAVQGADELADYARRIASPFFHPTSTCRMGDTADPDAVVDTRCKVRGVRDLRVVDASIFPSIPQAMTQAAVFAVAERAADLIRRP